jgi:hypothetical protein
MTRLKSKKGKTRFYIKISEAIKWKTGSGGNQSRQQHQQQQNDLVATTLSPWRVHKSVESVACPSISKKNSLKSKNFTQSVCVCVECVFDFLFKGADDLFN